jgi:hypothetical protein
VPTLQFEPTAKFSETYEQVVAIVPVLSSTVCMRITSVIPTFSNFLYIDKGGGAVLQGPLAVACIPHDLGTLLVSGDEGTACV